MALSSRRTTPAISVLLSSRLCDPQEPHRPAHPQIPRPRDRGLRPLCVRDYCFDYDLGLSCGSDLNPCHHWPESRDARRGGIQRNPSSCGYRNIALPVMEGVSAACGPAGGTRSIKRSAGRNSLPPGIPALRNKRESCMRMTHGPGNPFNEVLDPCRKARREAPAVRSSSRF